MAAGYMPAALSMGGLGALRRAPDEAVMKGVYSSSTTRPSMAPRFMAPKMVLMLSSLSVL